MTEKELKKLNRYQLLDILVMQMERADKLQKKAVDRVERSNSARAEVLIGEESDLTLFVRDAQLLEYIILRCVLK